MNDQELSEWTERMLNTKREVEAMTLDDKLSWIGHHLHYDNSVEMQRGDFELLIEALLDVRKRLTERKAV